MPVLQIERSEETNKLSGTTSIKPSLGKSKIGRWTAPDERSMNVSARSLFWARQVKSLTTPGNILTTVTGLGILAIWPASLAAGENRWIWAVALALALAGGAPIFIGAARGLAGGRSNVDELVSIAIIAAILGDEVTAAAVIAFMMNFGKMLEDLAEHVSGDAVAGLLELTPDVARLKTDAGYRETPASELSKGDVILVREGDKIAADGQVVTGSASVDQSSIVGESVPVRREVNDKVFAGTVNVEGVIEIRATETGEFTTISRVARLVEAARQRTAPVERVAQRYARYFTPAILLLAAIVFALTQDWRRSITILIVACPCSLVMATPTALVAGMARAALDGILIRGADVLEALSKVTTVALDKTGTITSGSPQVQEVVQLGDIGEQEVVKLAASAEMLSSHPLARAFSSRARSDGIELESPKTFEVVAGRGVVASVSNQTVSVGSHYLLEDPATPAAARPIAKDLRAKGLTCLTVGVDGEPAALVATRDTIRPGAREAIAELEKQGVRRTALLTGDSLAVASLIAEEVGVGEVHASLLPAQKLERVRTFQAAGEKVLMVGDGVNDAPALATADVGVAMGRSGADIAIESADVALLTDDISKVASAISLGKRSMSVVKFNLAFSLTLNAAAFVAAGLGALSPVGAAVLHNAGSLFIMLNAALLVARRR